MPVWRNQARNAGPKGPERPRPFPSRLISCEAYFSLREILRFTVSQFTVNAINREPTERSEVINHSQKWNPVAKAAGLVLSFHAELRHRRASNRAERDPRGRRR